MTTTTLQENEIAAAPAGAPCEASPPTATKPKLYLPHQVGDGLTVTESAMEIFSHAAKQNFFRRDSVVVRAVGRETEMKIEQLGTHSIRSALESVGRLVNMKANGPTKTPTSQLGLMTSDQANQLLGCAEAIMQLPEILGTTKCPILARTPSGAKLCSHGYSPELKLWVASNIVVEDVEVDEAVSSLLSLLDEFEFATPSDKSRAFAAFLSPMLHLGGWLPDQPVAIDVAEADQSQSGKTYRQNTVIAMYGDKPALVDLKSRGVGGMDESIQSHIFKGRAFISIDNAKVALDSGYVEQTITNTSGVYSVRLPGMRQVDVPAKFVLMISSNAAKMSRDLANRSSITRIVKKIGYQFKSDPKALVTERTGYYLGCVVSIIKEWARLGCPKSPCVDHDFRAWAGACDYIVQNIAGLPPLLDGHREAQARTNDPTLTFLREVALAIDGIGELGTSFSCARLLEIASAHSLTLAGVEFNGADEDSKSSARRTLGIKLKVPFKGSDFGSIQVDRYTVTRIESVRERDGGSGPVPEIRYQFTKSYTK